MVNKEDIDRLIVASEKVREILAPPPKNPLGRIFSKPPERKAAAIICDEFEWLVNENGTYWEGLQEASERLSEYRENEAELFRNIARLIEQEQIIFNKLGIEKRKSEEVIAHAYASLRIVSEYENPSPDSLANLRNRLDVARELICRASRGRLQRTYDKMLGHKGALILSGGAVAGANVAIAVVDQGAVSWVSLKAGYHIADGNVEELIKILSGE